MIQSLKEDGHYLGAHSDKHLLYASWENRDSTLIGHEVFKVDLRTNYQAMEQFGITKSDAMFYLPTYEWYNDTISAWTKELGLKLINFTPGTASNQDWTYPELGASYISSDELMKNISRTAERKPSGLNGHNLLIHFGTDPRRKDKLYKQLDEIISRLKQEKYQFSRIDHSAY